MIINWLHRRRIKKAVNAYLQQLPSRLVWRYGRQSSYTPAQITKTIDACSLSYLAKDYALVCFGDEVEIKKYFEENNQQSDFDEIYLDLKLNYFNGSEPNAITSDAIASQASVDGQNSGLDTE